MPLPRHAAQEDRRAGLRPSASGPGSNMGENCEQKGMLNYAVTAAARAGNGTILSLPARQQNPAQSFIKRRRGSSRSPR